MKPPKILTAPERRAHGESLRKKLNRADQAAWEPAADRNPIRTVLAANKGRLPDLVPVKMGRMSASPFAFFRGSASLMAFDLSATPVTGLDVQICGDAHVRNLGAYAAPDGHLVFDINDFDETTPGPWEWDLKRLAASVVLSGREAGDTDKFCIEAVITLVRYYREWMDYLCEMKMIDLIRFEIRHFSERSVIKSVLNKAKRVTPVKTLAKLTEPSKSGTPLFKHEPPVLHHIDNRKRNKVLESLKSYRDTVGAARQLVLDAYHPVDVAFKVVGTGSVGTRDYVVQMFGHGPEDPIYLQVKEELPSCYAPYLKHIPAAEHNGRRVAEGQQRMQTVTDPFLGWTTIDNHDFLVRQLADCKASIDPLDLKGRAMLEYAAVCGETLAKAHARTGDAIAMAGYCGDTAKLDKAIAAFAITYADQMTKDYTLFNKAIKAGKIKAVKGV